MLQRVVRQLRDAGIPDSSINIATSISQRDAIINQLGPEVRIVTEPERRDTFPAIALACSYLASEKRCPESETVVVMPCDPYTEAGYFRSITQMAAAVESSAAELVLMGITPTYPSSKYGYIVPISRDNSSLAAGTTASAGASPGQCSTSIPCAGTPGAIATPDPAKAAIPSALRVERFTEKPSEEKAAELIAQGAFWNGGVFAFRLGHLCGITRRYLGELSFSELHSRYRELPKISFDYEVVEKAESVAVVPFAGEWKDLGTWNTLSEELPEASVGNVTMVNSTGTHAVNELELPLLCIGLDHLIVAASPDGIIVADKAQSEKIKACADSLQRQPMYEERRWGEYKVVDEMHFADGSTSLTLQIRIAAGKSLSYQQHEQRDELWTILDGSALVMLDGEQQEVGRGDVLRIGRGVKHAIKALSDLRLIEVQLGHSQQQDDITRFPLDW